MNSISLIETDASEFLFHLVSVSVLAKKLFIPFPYYSFNVCRIFIMLLLFITDKAKQFSLFSFLDQSCDGFINITNLFKESTFVSSLRCFFCFPFY